MNPASSPSVVTLGPALADARALVVLVHGRGSSGHDMLGLAQHLAADGRAPGVAWHAPNAARGTWYPQRFLAPLAANEPDLSHALAEIGRRVAEGLAAGIPAERIALIGFSQGACLALEYVARHPRRLGFVAGLSGALIGPLDLPRAAADLAGTPVLLGCADHDAHIPLTHVEHSAAWLRAHGANVTSQVYPGSAHTIFPDELTWLQQAVATLAAAPGEH